MQILVDAFTDFLGAALSAANEIPADPATIGALEHDELLSSLRTIAEVRRVLDARASLVAGEINHRSRRELGYEGLAQRTGFRTPEALIQHETGSTARDASTLVRVDAIVHEALAEPSAEAWLTEVGIAVNDAALSIEAPSAISSGIGGPSAASGITPGDLAQAANTLLTEASELNADRLFARARDLRDELDAGGIADRERAVHEGRSLRRVRGPNGLSRYILDPDLESAAFWDDVYDKLTSPRRGGARFVDEADKRWAGEIAADTRSTEQYMHDSITQLLRIAVHANSTESHRIVGSRTPAVRVLVSADMLAGRAGHGRIEGSDVPISIETIERIACTSGTIAIAFDKNGQAINLGREQRLYSGQQRIALAARDGGCRWTDCDRPPSWAEAHHVKHWQRDRGSTDLADGILLCRHHHMLLHNNHWGIERRGAEYWLIPPVEVDPRQTPRLMPSKSAALRDLLCRRVTS
ncbi:MAG: hypothetical protein JWN09_146 [Microbacteriaceae bacterium]|nr:hypothetical protein [Microbacteriaceae bacterium]